MAMVSAKERSRRRDDRRKARAHVEAEKRRRVAQRMCLRFGLAFCLRWSDYRYWQCRRCGFEPEVDVVWQWWTGLHWMDRATLVRLSPHGTVRLNGWVIPRTSLDERMEQTRYSDAQHWSR